MCAIGLWGAITPRRQGFSRVSLAISIFKFFGGMGPIPRKSANPRARSQDLGPEKNIWTFGDGSGVGSVGLEFCDLTYDETLPNPESAVALRCHPKDVHTAGS